MSKGLIMRLSIICLLATGAVVSVILNSCGKQPDDSLFEEVIEFGIQQATGLDIDLTPQSDE